MLTRQHQSSAAFDDAISSLRTLRHAVESTTASTLVFTETCKQATRAAQRYIQQLNDLRALCENLTRAKRWH